MTDCILVRTPWQSDCYVHATRCNLTVYDPTPVYEYRQHGQTIQSRTPMIRVVYWCNDGRETGVVRKRDLWDVCYRDEKHKCLRSGKFRMMSRADMEAAPEDFD